MEEQVSKGDKQAFKSAFGDTLRAFRMDKGMSQRVLGRDSGVEHSSISRLERGEREPSLRIAVKLVDTLELSDTESLLLLKSGATDDPEVTVQTDSEKLLARLRRISNPIDELPKAVRDRLLRDTAENDRRRHEGLDRADLTVG